MTRGVVESRFWWKMHPHPWSVAEHCVDLDPMSQAPGSARDDKTIGKERLCHTLLVYIANKTCLGVFFMTACGDKKNHH